MNTKTIWKILTIIELAAVIAAVLLDLFMPTLLIIALMLVSLIIRREHIAALGFKRPASWPRIAFFALGTAAFLQLFAVGLLLPILNRLTGATIEYSAFANLQGNPAQLLILLALSWTLAAVGEELAYRGYLQKRLLDLFGTNRIAVLLVVGISSVLFGLAHTEQGIIGVLLTTLDALVFSWLKWKFDNNLWAAILAHGFYNSVGIIVFFFTGPIYALW